MNLRTIHHLKRCAVAVVFAFFASGLCLAQGPTTGPVGQSTKGAVIKGKAPVNKKLLKVNLPKAEEATLPNGLRVVVLPSHKVPTFNMQMVVLSGGLADSSDYRGLASFTAGLLRDGTTKRSSKEVAEQIDALGGTLASTAGLSSVTSTVSTSGLIENLDQTLDIFSDVVRNPIFPAGEVEKYKARTLAQQQFQRSVRGRS